MLRPLIFIATSEAAIGVLGQAEILPENLIGILTQVPFVAVIIWLQVQNQKWLEHMLEIQRESLSGIYDGQQAFLSALLAQIEAKQNRIIEHMEALTQQVSLFAATLSEVTKVDDVIDRLIEKIEK